MGHKHFKRRTKKLNNLHYLSSTNEPIRITIQNKHDKYSEIYKGRYWGKQTGTRTMDIQFSHSVVSNSLRPHGLQHTKLPCPSPTPRVFSNSCPLSQWCHSTISSSVMPFSSHLQSFPASGSFKWVSSSHQAAKVMELPLRHQSFQWIFRTDLL